MWNSEGRLELYDFWGMSSEFEVFIDDMVLFVFFIGEVWGNLDYNSMRKLFDG